MPFLLCAQKKEKASCSYCLQLYCCDIFLGLCIKYIKYTLGLCITLYKNATAVQSDVAEFPAVPSLG